VGSPNGSYSLVARAYDTAGNAADSAAVAVTISNAPLLSAAYDSALRAPRCTGIGAACTSGDLVKGRASIGPELNAPNTIHASCADGTYGTYHVTESLDALRVTTLDGTPLAPGKQVRIDATVWAYGSDYLDLYYAADASAPSWTFLSTTSVSGSGARVVSATYTLPTGVRLQAIRGNFRYGGSAGPCTTGSYNDRDDLAFTVDMPDTVAPSVWLTAPAAGATVSGAIAVTAGAEDDVGVARVDFLADGVLFASAESAPWTVGWNTAGLSGTHVLTAQAYDAAGNTSASAPVTVSVDSQSPAVVLTSPAPGAALRGAVAMTAEASDDFVVAEVEFLASGALVAADAAPPWQAAWDTSAIASGNYTLVARARDGVGHVAESAPVTVTIDNVAPNVALTSPAPGAALRGTVALEANASDDVAVARVEFYAGGALVGAVAAAPWSVAWNASSLATGSYALVARAYDAAGNLADSAPVTVAVDNHAPTVALTSPAAGATVRGAIMLTAGASDDLAVVRVEFYVNGALLGVDAAAPWSLTWTFANGAYTLTARAYAAAGNAADSAPVTITVYEPPIVPATYDTTLQVPRCSTVGRRCATGELVSGRSAVGPEWNAPNTVRASCADGAAGAFHVDESLDALAVSTIDGSAFAPGKSVRIEATVWASSSTDRLDLYYAASASAPSWTWLATLTPAGDGAQVLSTTYTLPAGALQIIRGNFRKGSKAGTCTNGRYDDRDDLAFAVGP
jgi:hypothetical protein